MKLTRVKLDPRALALRQLGPLRQLSDRELDGIANDLDEVEIDPGAVLTREGRVAPPLDNALSRRHTVLR